MSGAPRFLIVKLAAAGDVLLTTALARALRSAYPQATLGWITTAYAAPLLQHNPDVDELRVLRTPSGWQWLRALRNWQRRYGPSMILLAHRSRWLYATARLSGGGQVLAFGHTVPYRLEQHRLEQLAHLLAAAGIRAPAALRPRLQLSASELVSGEALWQDAGARTRWALAPGGASNPWSAMPNRVWPRERFLELAQRACAAGVALRWIGGAGDRDGVDWICRRLPEGARGNLAGVLPLRHSAGVIAAADLVIGNDSLPLVLAQALDRPALGMYGPTPAAQIHAPDQPFVQGLAGCGPCYDPRAGVRGQAYRCRHARCLEQVSVDAVWSSAQLYLRR
ncbi:MAG: glycosyltransferase family 9 protein [Acidobacteria bacterium]|nr:MAG: glycosyltransferase family 9 protein [Acidobacteriota bacterium]